MSTNRDPNNGLRTSAACSSMREDGPEADLSEEAAMRQQTIRREQLAIARKRGDLLAVAVLEGPQPARARLAEMFALTIRREWTETELRAAWGDR